MPFQLMRKLSLRHKRGQEEHKLRKASSSKGSLNTHTAPPFLPDELICKIIDRVPEYEQFRARRVSKAVKNHVDKKLEQITKIFVYKEDLETKCASGGWEKHKRHQVAMRIIGDTVEIVVDARWTARDVNLVVGVMAMFRKSIVEATIDAPIAELLVVSLSALDLQRWYTFQCFMKMAHCFNDDDMHMCCYDQRHDHDLYWPMLDSLTVRTTEQQSPHLARVIDYGVNSNLVLDRKRLSHIKVIYTDVEKSHKSLARNVFHFRCWAGSAGFDHRFEQQFTPAPTQKVIF